MLKLFEYNSATGKLELNYEELLVINEFNELMSPERNKCEEDPEGLYKLRAYREFKYIYLFLDWKSPLSDFPEQIRNNMAIKQAKLSKEEVEDPVFRTACRKYMELKNSLRSYKALQSAYKILDKLTIYFDELVDFTARNDGTGNLLYKAKDVIAEAKSLGPLLDSIREAELRYKKDLDDRDSKVKGDHTPGFFDLNRLE